MYPRHGKLFWLSIRFVDLIALALALGCAIWLVYAPEYYAAGRTSSFAVEFLSERVSIGNAVLGGTLLATWHASLSVQGIYLPNRLRSFRDEVREAARGVCGAGVALLVAAHLGGWETQTLPAVLLFAAFALIFIGAWRAALRMILRRARIRGRNVKRLLIIGTGERGRRFAERVTAQPVLGYQLLGYLDDESRTPHAESSHLLGSIEDLPAMLAREVVDEVVIALPIKSHYAQIDETIRVLEEQGVTTHLLTDLFPYRAHHRAAEFQGTPLLSLHSSPPANWDTEVKRIFDFVVASLLLILLAPLFVLVAILIKIDSRGSVFFVQNRMGFNKRRFRLYKFRTMTPNAETRISELEHLNEKTGPIFKMRRDPRVTRVGRYLRRASIDELPQLLNVLRGDMSLVGPRPLSVRDALGMEEAWQRRRFSVKPGITGLWQVSGRSNLSFEEWMQLDLEYIDRWSLKLDCRILLRTIPAVVIGEGAV